MGYLLLLAAMGIWPAVVIGKSVKERSNRNRYLERPLISDEQLRILIDSIQKMAPHEYVKSYKLLIGSSVFNEYRFNYEQACLVRDELGIKYLTDTLYDYNCAVQFDSLYEEKMNELATSLEDRMTAKLLES